MKICKTCGLNFTPTTPGHLYCSFACRPSTPPKKDDLLNCLTCGSIYTRVARAQKYCCRACRVSLTPEYKLLKAAEAKSTAAGRMDRSMKLARRAQVRELQEAGMTFKEIGQVMGVNYHAVQYLLRKGPQGAK